MHRSVGPLDAARWPVSGGRSTLARVSAGITGIPGCGSYGVADSRLTSFGLLTKRRDPVVDSRLET